ncbi:LysR substrate-binding domain-containing protein [Klebsiella pneumoniae subsp. pneumoniae]|nr:LysR substrate-binding domain-containing protein [Klebsiella pneumoniae subsp. pneumoniae]
MAQNVLARITAKMLKEYPGLSVNLVTGIPAPDLIADGLDVVIRVGALQDSSLFPAAWAQCRWYYAPLKAIWRRLAIQRNRPTLPDMPGWNIACGRTMSLSLSRRKDLDPPDPAGRFVTNDPMTLVRWLTAGVGIAYVPLMWAIEEINRGELEILLPSYQSDPRPVYALYTEKDKLPLKVQVCINYLTEYFVDVAKIYQGMHGRGIAR